MKGSPPCDQRWWSELLPLRYGCGFSSSQCSGSHHPHLISRGLFIHRVYAWVARWRISRRMRFWFPGPGFWGHPLGPDPGRISDGEWAVFAPSLKISWGCCPALGNLGHSHLLGSWLCPPESSTPGRLDFLISLWQDHSILSYYYLWVSFSVKRSYVIFFKKHSPNWHLMNNSRILIFIIPLDVLEPNI